MFFIGKLHLAALALTVCALPPAISAASVITQTYTGSFPATISGTLPNEGTALEEAITLPTAGSLTAFTTSFLTGGFEPNLTLFNAAGNYVAASLPQGSAPLAPEDFDAYLNVSGLMAGQYTLALTDWELGQSLTATNLSDGFTFNLGDGVNFVNPTAIGPAYLSGNYSLTVDVSQTPEPGTILLVAPLLLAAGLVGRKKVLSANK